MYEDRPLSKSEAANFFGMKYQTMNYRQAKKKEHQVTLIPNENIPPCHANSYYLRLSILPL